MLKISKNLFIALFIILSIIFIIIGTKDVMLAVNNAIMLWATRVFPVLFPFYIVTSLAVTYGVAHLIGDLLKPITRILFKTSPISGFVFFMSLISGNPSSAIIISKLYENKSITKNEAQHLLSFSVFVNPIFCIGAIGYAYFNNVTIGYIVLISHISANLLIGIIMRFGIKNNEKENFSLKHAYSKMVNEKTKNKLCFSENLTKILQEGMNTMFLIAGFMIFYNIIIVILKSTLVIYYSYHYLSFLFTLFNINYQVYYTFFIGLFEMVIGVDNVVNSNFDLRTTVTFITMLISFGGLSIHSQIQSILLKVKLKYYPFLLSRLSQMTFSGIIAYYIFPLIYNEETKNTFYLKILNIEEKNILLISLLFLISTLFLSLYKTKLFKTNYS